MHKEGHKKLHGKKVKIFEDKAGNKLFKKRVPEVHTTWQLSATNNKGKVVGLKGVKDMVTKAKRSDKSGFWMDYSQKRGPGEAPKKGFIESVRKATGGEKGKVFSVKTEDLRFAKSHIGIKLASKGSKTPSVLSSKPLKQVYG